LYEPTSYWIVVQIGQASLEILPVADAVIGESSLPDGELRCKSTREATLDELDRALQRDLLRSENDMDVVGHDDETEQLVVTLATILLECFDQEVCIIGSLEKPAPIVSGCRDEICPRLGRVSGNRHALPSVPQGLKPRSWQTIHGTAEAVPLTKHLKTCP
jgi:hypothetical protein